MTTDRPEPTIRAGRPDAPPVGVGGLARPAPAVDHHRAPLAEVRRRCQKAGPDRSSDAAYARRSDVYPDLSDRLDVDAAPTGAWRGPESPDLTQRAAEDLAAAAWGADRVFFLGNGSASGTHAFLLATLGPGDEVVVGRDMHQSVRFGLIRTGAKPIFVAPRLHSELGIGLGIAVEDVATALDAHPAARLLVLTSPTSWGLASNVAAIVGVAHARGIPVYVDETWGAHFPFHPALPPSAMMSGADGAVTSAPKLPSTPRRSALLQVQGSRVDVECLAATVSMAQATSRSLPVLASLDACRRLMAIQGEALLERAIGLAFGARRRLDALPGLIVCGSHQFGGVAYDPTRLVIDVQGLGMTGFCAARALHNRFGLAPAMANGVGVVCVVGLGDTPESVARLVEAFAVLATGAG